MGIIVYFRMLCGIFCGAYLGVRLSGYAFI